MTDNTDILATNVYHLPPIAAACPWCGPNGDPQVVDLDCEGAEPDDDSSSVAVVCETCQAQGPCVGRGCHDEGEDGPLALALTGAAIAAWNERSLDERITVLESQNARMKAALEMLSPRMTWAECATFIDAALRESP